ncbi:MAG: sensor histidine kinase [Chloroflexota bacterium]
MKWRWLSVPLPALLALALSALLYYSSSLPNPVLRMRISLNVVVLLGGVLLSLLLALALGLHQWQQQRYRAALEQQRRDAAADRRRFVQRLDHELKNPLTAIRAALANIGGAPASSAHHDALRSIEAQTVRLSRLTADLRKIAELESRPLERGPVDLNALLQEVVDLARDKPESNSRRLSLTLPQAPWPLPTISGDWDLLFLAVYNLVENALKYTRTEDTIEVRAREDGSRVVIDVADTGPGIDADDLPHVWEELYRGTAARGASGSGLGLALVRSIAERHGGEVHLQSRAGHGTVFTLQLPVT